MIPRIFAIPGTLAATWEAALLEGLYLPPPPTMRPTSRPPERKPVLYNAVFFASGQVVKLFF